MTDDLFSIDRNTWDSLGEIELRNQQALIRERMDKLLIYAETAGMTPSVQQMGMALEEAILEIDRRVAKIQYDKQQKNGTFQ